MKDRLYEWTGNRRRDDVILAAIPASFGLSHLVGLYGGLGDPMAILVATIASGLLLLDALVVNPPDSETT